MTNWKLMLGYLACVGGMATAVWFTRGPLQLTLFIIQIIFTIGFVIWFTRGRNEQQLWEG